MGIPEVEQRDIFQSLYRAANRDEVAGNDFGLAIVRKHLDEVGGHLDLHSVLGQATTVTVDVLVVLPLETPQEREYVVLSRLILL